MRYWLFLFSLLFLNLSLKAHEANEAFFVVKQQGNKTIVESEFPWTMRNALLAFDLELFAREHKVYSVLTKEGLIKIKDLFSVVESSVSDIIFIGCKFSTRFFKVIVV